MNNNSTMIELEEDTLKCDKSVKCLNMDEAFLNNLLQCSVCLEQLDYSSKSLPCQHTFCKRCLYGILNTNNELRCPVCRKLVEAEIEELPSNILLVCLLDGIKYLQPTKVDNNTDIASRSAESSSSSSQQPTPSQPQLSQPKRNLLQASSVTDLSAKKQDLYAAMLYVNEVEHKFRNQREAYNYFLHTLSLSNSQRIDVTVRNQRIRNLFRDHPELIVGLNAFLPLEERLEVQPNEQVQGERDTRSTVKDYSLDIPNDYIEKILPNSVQLVKSDFPLSEANNCDKFAGVFLFRQIFSSYDFNLQCLLCRDNYCVRFPADLEKHYQVIHELAVNTIQAEFNENIIFVSLRTDVNEEINLAHDCRICGTTLKTLAEMRDHYHNVHNKIVARVLSESETRERGNYFYCSLCGHSSVDFPSHHQHMKVMHRMQTYHTFGTNHLRTHLEQRHLQDLHESRFQCSACSIYVYGKDRLAKHIMAAHATQTGPNTWLCAKCLYAFHDPHVLAKHIPSCPKLQSSSVSKTNEATANSHTDYSVCHKCNFCGLTFSSEEKIKKHTADIHCSGSSEEVVAPNLIHQENYACFLCYKIFPHADMCQTHQHHFHMQWVTKEAIEYSEVEFVENVPDDNELDEMRFLNKVGHFCHLCDIVIGSYRLYYHHMRNLHQFEKRFRCIITACGRTFTQASEFQNHTLDHNQKSEHCCHICDKVFGNNEELQDHLISYDHMTKFMQIKKNHCEIVARNHHCKVCHTWFGLFATFVKHMETESHSYQCRACGSLFTQPGPRRCHIQATHPEIAHICEICGLKLSKNKEAVWQHLLIHDVVHECPKCHRRFTQKEHLATHLLDVHMPRTPCPWNGCNRKLTTRTSLFNHLRMHAGDTDFKCTSCNKGFISKKVWKSHMRMHSIRASLLMPSAAGHENVTDMGHTTNVTINQQVEEMQIEEVELSIDLNPSEIIGYACTGCKQLFDTLNHHLAHNCTSQATADTQLGQVSRLPRKRPNEDYGVDAQLNQVSRRPNNNDGADDQDGEPQQVPN